MRPKRRQLIQTFASVAALAALPAARALADEAALPNRHVIGFGTAGSALVAEAERLGVFGARDFVRIWDRDPSCAADHPGFALCVDTLRFAEQASALPHETLVLAALGGRDGGRFAKEYADEWDARCFPHARRTAIFIMPYKFEAERYARAEAELLELSKAFHHVHVLRNEDAMRDPEELWSAVHERANAAVFAALYRS